MTSSTFATTWKKFAGTSSHPPLPCRPRWPATSEKYLEAYFQLTGHELDV